MNPTRPHRHDFNRIRSIAIAAFCAISGAWLVCTGCQALQTAGGKAIIYPWPGKLTAIAGLEESSTFDLLVNGQDAFVYHGFNPNSQGSSGRGVSFCSFQFSGKAGLEIRTASPLINWKTYPDIDTIKKLDDAKITLELIRPVKFILQANLLKGGAQCFVISAEAIEKSPPSRTDPSVLYLQPGIHQKDPGWNPFQNGVKTLYLAPGAVLQATLAIQNQNDITIGGYGVITQPFATPAAPAGISFRDCNNVRVETVSFLSGPACRLELIDCDHCLARNLKLCGVDDAIKDRIYATGRSVLVENCTIVSSNNDSYGLEPMDSATAN